MSNPTKHALHVVLSLSCLAAGFASYAIFAEDGASRLPADRFAEKYQLPLRRPEIVDSLKYAPSGAFATDLVADATLRDVVVPISLNGLAPEVRAAWLDAVPRYEEQMADATELSLDAIAERPGWPYHASLVGQLTYTQDVRALSADLIERHARWSEPLYSAAMTAGSDEGLWQSLALAYVQTWPALSPAHSATAPQVFRNAFVDPEFLRRTLGPTMQIVGKDTALASIPESPAALWEAFEQLNDDGDIASAWRLHQRWDAAEWESSVEDLRTAERALRSGDVNRGRQLCERWAARHSVWNYDSAAAHQMAIRLLEIWPSGRRGVWPNDARARIVRYLLPRIGDRTSAGPLKVIEDLDYVPDEIRAECQLVAGDIGESWRVATEAADFGVSNDWTNYIVAAVRAAALQGDRSRAARLAQYLPRRVMSGCTGAAVTSLLSGNKTSLSAQPAGPTSVPAGTAVVICTPSGRMETTILAEAGTACIADVTVDSARVGSLSIPAEDILKVTVRHQPGLRTIAVAPLSVTRRERSR